MSRRRKRGGGGQTKKGGRVCHGGGPLLVVVRETEIWAVPIPRGVNLIFLRKSTTESDVGPRIYPREYAEYAGFLVFWVTPPCGYSVERGRHCFRFFPATHLSRSVPGTSVYHVVPLLSLLFRLHVAIAILFGSKWRDVFVSPWFSRKKLLAQILGVNNGFF